MKHVFSFGAGAISVVALLCSTATRLGAQTRALPPLPEPMAGLNWRVTTDAQQGWPRPARDMQMDAGRHFDSTSETVASRHFSPIDFGMIRSAADVGEGVLQDFERTPVGATAVFTAADDDSLRLEVTSSRLFPGLWIKAKGEIRSDGTCSGDILLFSGNMTIGTEGFLTAGSQPCLQNKGWAPPRHFAAKTAGGVSIRPLEELESLPLEGLEQGWLLAWYGKNTFFYGVDRADFSPVYGWGGIDAWDKASYPADTPMLILFNSAPSRLAMSGGLPEPGKAHDGRESGVEIAFQDMEGGSLVVLPLLGEALPRAEDTENWAKGLPAEIMERCDWWAANMRGVPVEVSETYEYDEKQDITVVKETFTFAKFRESGNFSAPVPAMPATAALEGFPIEFSAPWHDPGLMTPVGSYLAVPGVESYEMRFKGLNRYVVQRPAPQGKPPEKLVARLAAEVEKIIEAGHLAPWLKERKNIWGGNFIGTTQHLVHANPGETLYFLAEAVPFLNEALRERTLDYMKREREQYPPERCGILPGNEGGRREAYEFSVEFLSGDAQLHINYMRPHNFYVRNKLVPRETLLHLARYYETLGGRVPADEALEAITAINEPYLQRADWATGGAFQWPGAVGISSYGKKHRSQTDIWYGNGGVVDMNNAFAGCIGHVRLARMAGITAEETKGRGLLARAAAARFAMGKMAGHLYARGLLKADWPPEQDVRQPHYVDEYGMTLLVKCMPGWYGGLLFGHGMTPELALFIRDFLKPEAERYYGEWACNIPHWWQAWCESGVESECNCPWPQDAYQAFLVHALALDAAPEWLELRLDVPWQKRGDLFYLQKLVETIRAAAR